MKSVVRPRPPGWPPALEFLAGRPVVAVHEASSEEGAHPLLPSHRVENKRCPSAVMAGEQYSGERCERPSGIEPRMTRSPPAGRSRKGLREQQHLFGRVAERLKAPVLKTGGGQPSVGSNPHPFRQFAAVAQMAEQPLCKGTRAGSMPAGGTITQLQSAPEGLPMPMLMWVGAWVTCAGLMSAVLGWEPDRQHISASGTPAAPTDPKIRQPKQDARGRFARDEA